MTGGIPGNEHFNKAHPSIKNLFGVHLDALSIRMERNPPHL
jgi:hypothetical protein